MLEEMEKLERTQPHIEAWSVPGLFSNEEGFVFLRLELIPFKTEKDDLNGKKIES